MATMHLILSLAALCCVAIAFKLPTEAPTPLPQYPPKPQPHVYSEYKPDVVQPPIKNPFETEQPLDTNKDNLETSESIFRMRYGWPMGGYGYGWPMMGGYGWGSPMYGGGYFRRPYYWG